MKHILRNIPLTVGLLLMAAIFLPKAEPSLVLPISRQNRIDLS